MAKDYEFPDEDFLGVCKVSKFTDGKMHVSNEGQDIAVNIPAEENWEERFKQGETLEVYAGPDNFTHYRRYQEPVDGE